MLPRDVASNGTLRRRFHEEVAYGDRLRPSDAEVQADAQLLESSAGVLIVAWLWPSPSYEPEFDPFASVTERSEQLMRDTHKRAKLVGSERELEFAAAVDRERESRLLLVASRAREIFESTAEAVGCSVVDLRTHLRWCIRAADVGRVVFGPSPVPLQFAFSAIIATCDALHLEFTDAWVVVDPQRLAASVERSLLATKISDSLRHLSLDDLERTDRGVQRRRVDAGNREQSRLHRAPKKGGRYSSLYEVLASDERERPHYRLDEIDRLLLQGGERPLPDSARRDRSWWAGSEAKGHPQVGAWRGAGYRVRGLDVDQSGRIASVGFAALPGRSSWLTDAERTEHREYQPPSPETVEIYRRQHDRLHRSLTDENYPAMAAVAELVAAKLESLEIPRLAAEWRRLEPADPDVRDLVKFLEEVGEADRSQIERHFNRSSEEPTDASWTRNLLNRARRQGWTVNNGTRSRPRWASTARIAKLMFEVADNLGLQRPTLEPRDAVPVEFVESVARALDIGAPNRSAPETARTIIEWSGKTWQPDFVSAAGAVTGLFLEAIRQVMLFPDEPT